MRPDASAVEDDATLAPVNDDIIPARFPGRWLAAIVCLILLALLVSSLWTNPGYNWGVVAHYFTMATVLGGLGWTLLLTVLAMAIGIAIGIIAALMRQSSNPVLSLLSAGYIWFFRGTPVLVQLIFWYNMAALYPKLSFGLPFMHPFLSVETNTIITPIVAALLGLGLNEGAYMAEIVRAGLLSIDTGQQEASRSLGLSPAQTVRWIILPQALRVIIPPTGNEIIGMLKATSLVSVLSISDLLYTVQGIYGRTFQTIPLLIVASLWYLIASTILSGFQGMLEHRFGRGHGVGGGDGTSLVLAVLRGSLWRPLRSGVAR